MKDKVIVGEHLDYEWTPDAIQLAIKLALEGYNASQISEMLEREFIETLILLDELVFVQRIPKKNNLLRRNKEVNHGSKILSTV